VVLAVVNVLFIRFEALFGKNNFMFWNADNADLADFSRIFLLGLICLIGLNCVLPYGDATN